MAEIKIKLSGVAAELVLGNYMPSDPTIFQNWEDFFHYNDLIHTSQLLSEHISEIEIKADGEVIYLGGIPANRFVMQKSSSPVMLERALYLRAECAEQAVFECSFHTDNFDRNKLKFETQDHDLLFKVAGSFINCVIYEDQKIEPVWVSGTPIGNICLLCRYEQGYLKPLFDAINKIEAQ